MAKLGLYVVLLLCLFPQYSDPIDISRHFPPTPNWYELLTSGVSKRCTETLGNLTIVDRIKLLDALGRPRSGILSGNVHWFGAFDECLSLNNTRYCLVFIDEIYTVRMLESLRYGLCIPNACSETDLINIVENVLKYVVNRYFPAYKLDKNITASGIKCYEKPSISGRVKFAIVMFSLVLLCCLIGTLIEIINETLGYGEVLPVSPPAHNGYEKLPDAGYEKLPDIDHKILTQEIAPLLNSIKPIYKTNGIIGHTKQKTESLELSAKHEKQEEEHEVDKRDLPLRGFLVDIFLCFSLLTNARKVFDTNVSRNSITSLHGIRILSLFWVMLGHTYLRAAETGVVENMLDMVKDSERFTMMAVSDATYAVDSFLFLSGLLLMYNVISKIEKNNGGINWAWFYLHRYVRLTPVLMFVILFVANIEEFFCESPMCSTLTEPKNCRDYWWTNLFYINNFYPTNNLNDACLSVSWYLAIDTQFYIITPIFIFCFYRYRYKGMFILSSLVIIMSGLITAYLIHHYGLDALAQLPNKLTAEGGKLEAARSFRYSYTKPYCRIQPYIVGLVFGYLMHTKLFKAKAIGWFGAIIFWILAFALAVTVVYAPYTTAKHNGREWTPGENMVFASVNHFLWAVALSWVVYACEYGYGGYVNEFLSAKFWIPLGRLNYCAYLCHFQLMTIMFLGYKTGLHYSTAVMIYYFCAALLLSYGIAFLFVVTVEFPFSNLERIIITRCNKDKRK